MKVLGLVLAVGLVVSGGLAGCSTTGSHGRSGTPDRDDRTPTPEGAALGTGPWSLTGRLPPDSHRPALGRGAPAPPSP